MAFRIHRITEIVKEDCDSCIDRHCDGGESDDT